ncbi:MAG: 2-C-methyl-D-erythritol 4-phosphate cytidylyltransferase [Bacteroidota bacterium]|nr:2-C-methyl-D-erythritol 4-phosphate cytidylyltransferase [Bacteroidota bacterium]
MKKYALIVAGGKGLRMDSEIPKQFLELKGLPVLMHTITAFSKFTDIDILLVLPKEQIAYWQALCVQYNFNIPHQIIEGGETRFHSVRNGLKQITDMQSLVAIHDGVRPIVKPEIIESSFKMAEEKGNAVTVVKLKDSIRKLELGGNKSANRNNYYLVQTPQTFQTQLILDAYNRADHYNFTDDAGVLEESGYEINLLEGDYKNIKITNPEDLIIAAAFLDLK